MIAKLISHKGREMIHWLWLWTLAAIVVVALHGKVQGQKVQGQQSSPSESSESIPIEGLVDAKPIPMPNIDQPDLFRYPYDVANPNGVAVADVLALNRAKDFQRAIKAWHNLRMAEDSIAWKQVGIGVAYLRLDELDKAIEHLTRAVKHDPSSAVAEYFLGQARVEQSRDVPFWFEMKDEAPYRLAAYIVDQDVEKDRAGSAQAQGRAVVPPFMDPKFKEQAQRHFRRAIDLATKCDLNQTINVIQPVLQFAGQWPVKPPTARDLLISFGEANYVEKAQAELGERLETRR